MCYVDWMKNKWEIKDCTGTTDLETQDFLKFDEVNGQKKILFESNNLPWAEGISYSSNGDIVMGTLDDGRNFQITRQVFLNGAPAELSCTISDSVNGGGGSSLQAVFQAVVQAVLTVIFPWFRSSSRASRRRGVYGGYEAIQDPMDPGYGGSWTALEGGLT